MFLNESGLDPLTGINFTDNRTKSQSVKFYEGFEEQVDPADPENGLKRFVPVDMVIIEVPGARSNFDGRATHEHKIRFADQWKAYKESKPQEVVGIPISQWAYLTKAQVEELLYKKIYSVEQLAGLPDPECARLGMGIKDLRNKAQIYLRDAKDAEASIKAQAQIDKLKEMVEKLSAQVAEKEASKVEAPATAKKKSETKE